MRWLSSRRNYRQTGARLQLLSCTLNLLPVGRTSEYNILVEHVSVCYSYLCLVAVSTPPDLKRSHCYLPP